MKKAVSFLVLALFLSGCARLYYHGTEVEPLFAEPEKEVQKAPTRVMIHEGIGDTLDREEAERYGWFKDIIGFEYAVFHETEKGDFLILFETGREMYASKNGNRNTLKMLRDFIDGYDAYKDSMKLFEKKWGITDYDALGLPITKDDFKVVKRSCGVAGGLGCGIAGAFPLVVLWVWAITAEGYGIPSEPNWVELALFSIGAEAASITIGSVTGNHVGHKWGISRVKNSRKPKIVE